MLCLHQLAVPFQNVPPPLPPMMPPIAIMSTTLPADDLSVAGFETII
jgi:hypothetical protein